MPLLNYSTTVPAAKTVGQIQGILAGHGARAVMMEYGDGGQITALAFQVEGPLGPLSIKLPVDAKSTLRMLDKSGAQPRFCTRDHAYRVAWRIIKDWVEAQMALLETEMVKMEQIFLPYIITGSGLTVYEIMEKKQFLLGRGDND